MVMPPVPPASRTVVIYRTVHLHHRVATRSVGLDGGSYAQVTENHYARPVQTPPAAPAYDAQIDVPPGHPYARVDEHYEGHVRGEDTYYQAEERHNWRDEAYVRRDDRAYVRPTPVDCNCYRAEAAGRDTHGFLTWPGKVPARP